MNSPDTASQIATHSKQTHYSKTFDSLGTIKVIRLVGYGLLVFALLDICAMVVPFEFKNAVWEFQRFGELVERLAVPLIGLAMVFYAEHLHRSTIERYLLKSISWASLLVGIGFILLVPIAASNANRINTANRELLSAEYSQQQSRAAEIEQQIAALAPDRLASFLASQKQSVEGNNPSEIKDTVLKEFAQSREQLIQEFESSKAQRQSELLRDAIKWCLGALVAGVLFIYLWVLTAWARELRMVQNRLIVSNKPKPQLNQRR